MLPLLVIVTTWSPVVNDDPVGPKAVSVRALVPLPLLAFAAVRTTLRFPDVICWLLAVEVVNTA
jgi:hypothetical protein